MISESAAFLDTCIRLAREHLEHQEGPVPPTESAPSALDDSSISSLSTSLLPRSSVSEAEARFYYAGLPSNPKLIYRTGTVPWTMSSLETRLELRPVFGHKLDAMWKDIGQTFYGILDSMDISWTSIDVVRFMRVKEEQVTISPVTIWIGITPNTLSGEDAHTAAFACLSLLEDFGITDVDVEYRESKYVRMASPNLLEHVSDSHPTVDVRSPFTPTLGLSIAAQATPHIEGTGGLYLAEGRGGKKVFLVTVRHVLFPPDQECNTNYYKSRSAPRRGVLLLGTHSFNRCVEKIQVKIGDHGIMAEKYRRDIENLDAREAGDENDAERATGERNKIQNSLDKVNEAVGALAQLHDEIMRKWSQPYQRVIGHVVRSPPITLGAGTEGFTEDYGIIELDSSKFKKSFRGNVIDLGTKILATDFTSNMHPCIDAPTSFRYPRDRLLQLRGVISERRMRNPDAVDGNREPCLLVIKNGNSSGVTIGRATGIFSFVRTYSSSIRQTSMEWAIFPYDKSGPFSQPGDSGSIIADGRGRIGGLLTGGSGNTVTSDVTYATPFFWLLSRIKNNGFPNVHINPIIT